MGQKYPCEECDYQATEKSSLTTQEEVNELIRVLEMKDKEIAGDLKRITKQLASGKLEIKSRIEQITILQVEMWRHTFNIPSLCNVSSTNIAS